MSGQPPLGLAHCEDSKNTPLLLPTSDLEVQTEPILTKCLLSLVVQLVLQVLCFGPARRRSFMIPTQLLASFSKFKRGPYMWILVFLLDERIFLILAGGCTDGGNAGGGVSTPAAPSVNPNFPVSERTCSRDGHLTDFSVIASVVHPSLECEIAIVAEFVFFSSRFRDVFVHSPLRTCILLEIWMLHTREHANYLFRHLSKFGAVNLSETVNEVVLYLSFSLHA